MIDWILSPFNILTTTHPASPGPRHLYSQLHHAGGATPPRSTFIQLNILTSPVEPNPPPPPPTPTPSNSEGVFKSEFSIATRQLPFPHFRLATLGGLGVWGEMAVTEERKVRGKYLQKVSPRADFVQHST